MSAPPPSKIIAVHVNYRSRALQRGSVPAWPSYFLKPPSPSRPAAIRSPGRRDARCSPSRARWRSSSGSRASRVRPRRGLEPCRLGDGRQRLRRVRPALRRPRRQRPLQGHRRADAARPAAARRAHDRSRPRCSLRTWKNGEIAQDAKLGEELLFGLERHRRGPVPADDPGTGGRDPDRDAGRVDGRRAGRPGRDRGHRRGCDDGTAAQPDRRGPVHPAAVRRDAADDGRGQGRRVRVNGQQSEAGPAAGARSRPRRCWPAWPRCPPPRWPPSCASGG